MSEDFCEDHYSSKRVDDRCCLPVGHLGVHAGWPVCFATGCAYRSRLWARTEISQEFVAWVSNYYMDDFYQTMVDKYKGTLMRRACK